MNLDRSSIERWVEALRQDFETPVAVPADKGPLSQFTHDAEWRVGFYLTAFFYVEDDAMQERLITDVPAAFERFDALSGRALTHEKHPKTGKVLARGVKSLPGIQDRFESGRGDVASINAFSQGTKESSPAFFFNSVCDFSTYSRPGGDAQMLSFFSVRMPASFWRLHRTPLEQWWSEVLALLLPEQAYSGLALTNPPILERYPFLEPAEFALCKAFYGLDVDKPFFMIGSPYCAHKFHLELGTRTPTFGTLVRGKLLEGLGDEAAVRAALQADARIRISPCADGLWIEAGDEPALYPVEQGIPTHYAKVAKLMKPTRLDSLWLISYLPPLPRDDIFTPATARRWLKRFDDDGDWPSTDVRFWQPEGGSGVAVVPTGTAPSRMRALPGEPVPSAGWWTTPALGGGEGRRYLKAGERLPSQQSSPWGAVIWYLET